MSRQSVARITGTYAAYPQQGTPPEEHIEAIMLPIPPHGSRGVPIIPPPPAPPVRRKMSAPHPKIYIDQTRHYESLFASGVIALVFGMGLAVNVFVPFAESWLLIVMGIVEMSAVFTLAAMALVQALMFGGKR